MSYLTINNVYEQSKDKIELNKLKYLKLINELAKKGVIIKKNININCSLQEIIQAYELTCIEHKNKLQKLNTITNMCKIALYYIDPEWETKLNKNNDMPYKTTL